MLSFKRWPELVNPLIFFAVVTTLFPLAMSPDQAILQPLGIGVAWVAAFLASLLALDGLFRNDVEDGAMEQLLLSPAPLGITVLAKIAAHWTASAVPLLIVVPLAALTFSYSAGCPANARRCAAAGDAGAERICRARGRTDGYTADRWLDHWFAGFATVCAVTDFRCAGNRSCGGR